MRLALLILLWTVPAHAGAQGATPDARIPSWTGWVELGGGLARGTDAAFGLRSGLVPIDRLFLFGELGGSDSTSFRDITWLGVGVEGVVAEGATLSLAAGGCIGGSLDGPDALAIPAGLTARWHGRLAWLFVRALLLTTVGDELRTLRRGPIGLTPLPVVGVGVDLSATVRWLVHADAAEPGDLR